MALTTSLALPAKELPQSNIVKGRVDIEGTQTEIPGLVVQLFDVVVARDSPGPQVRHSLGSTITNNGFTISFSDELLLKVRPDGSRPNLLISITAPTVRARDNANRPIFETEVRQSAAVEECFLIHIELAELKAHNIPLPSGLGEMPGDPSSAGAVAQMKWERETALHKQLNEVRKKAVVEARKFEDEAEKDLRDRVVKHLTGITPGTPQWKRFVPPGEDAQEITRAHHKEAIHNVINKEARDGTSTFLVLSQQEFQALGNPPDPAKVERLLRQRNRTSMLLRADPAVIACSQRRDENPFDRPSEPIQPPPNPPSPTPLSSVDAKVSELVQGIRAPEDSTGNGGRPDQNTVHNNVANLQIAKGPADVAAFYDFHNLEIAFDHVWEDARAEGVLESAKTMYRTITDAGGDPKLALQTSSNPVRALSQEIRLVRQAAARFAAPRTSLQSARNSNPTGDIYPVASDVHAIPSPQTSLAFNPTAGIDSTSAVSAPLTEGYPFTVFADKSINFGLLVGYQLKLEPGPYQVGRLVSTQTLAPKESISITHRNVVKTSFNRKQVQSSQQSRKEDADDTFREEAEIVGRAQSKTNFALTSQGGYDLGPFGSGSFTTAFGKDKESGSQETKKAFHEAVRKSAQEFRDEQKWELETGETSEAETTEKRELSNPNDELALTYIFYELQRRYTASSRLHSVRPVVLVGQYVPRPDEINDQWVRRYDWIIKRFLPDDTFRAALEYLAMHEPGDRIVLKSLEEHMNLLRTTVDDLKQQVLTARNQGLAGYAAIEAIARDKADIENRKDFFWNYYANQQAKADNSEPAESKNALKILEESARESYDRAVREERDLRARMDREVTALQAATDAYTRAQSNYTNQRSQIDRLIQYLRSDILRYMHGIWSYEHPDQCFFRHHTILAPRLESVQRSYTLALMNEWPIGVVPQPGKRCYRVTFTVEVNSNLDSVDQKATLAELADLDHPLGYKGNYMIFPLKESNALTDFMITPYLDAELGLRDPDSLGNWTLQEFSDYVQCLRKTLGERFAEIEPDLRRHYQALLADPLRDGEEIIVPTKSLYMQMLVDPGKALEEFKEQHRKWDVEKVKAEVLSAQLDNLRRAKLVLGGHLEDPNIESVKNVYYKGEVPPHDGDE